MNLIPLPKTVRPLPGTVTLAAEPPLAHGEMPPFAIELLTKLLRPREGETTPTGARVTLQIDPTLPLGEEGYTLEALPNREEVHLLGKTARGLLHGAQTLRQLLPLAAESDVPYKRTLPAVQIEDEPRFPWRGAMLDVARHFLPLEALKRFLDAMALHKLNVLHWHLTDDQGWRIEIRKYPRLTDGAPYYTQEEAREIVAHATARGITIVPEIEIPGHSSAALAAYPHFGNDDLPGYAPTRKTTWGIFPHLYAPKAETLTFLEETLKEVLEIFPGPFLHIGGDEAPKEEWQASPQAQAFLQRENLADEAALQGWFTRHFETFLTARGRRPIGWDEILEGGVTANAANIVVMAWRGEPATRAALARGCLVIQCPTTHCYLDYPQDDTPLPYPSAAPISLEKIYTFEPIPAGCTPEEATRIHGLQGTLWSEHIPDEAQLHRMAFPRLCALAEVGWSPAESRALPAFLTRLCDHHARLRATGIQAYS